MSVYSLQSVFDENKIQVINVSKNTELLKRQMKKRAVDFICDSIGKNNFVDTLDGEEYATQPLKYCPDGYVLRYHDDDKLRIDVYTKKTTPGYIYGKTRDIQLVGYYMILTVEEEIDESIHLSVPKNNTLNRLTEEDRQLRANIGALMPGIAVAAKERLDRIREGRANVNTNILTEDARVDIPPKEESESADMDVEEDKQSVEEKQVENQSTTDGWDIESPHIENNIKPAYEFNFGTDDNVNVPVNTANDDINDDINNDINDDIDDNCVYAQPPSSNCITYFPQLPSRDCEADSYEWIPESSFCGDLGDDVYEKALSKLEKELRRRKRECDRNRARRMKKKA